MSLKYWLILIVLGIAFGSSFFFNEVLLREIAPLSISAARVLLGALTCWLVVIATGRTRRIDHRLALALFVHGAVCFALPFAVLAFAQQFTTSGTAGIANALTPIMVVIVSHMWPGGERATVLKSFGVLFGFAGIVAMALPTLRTSGSQEFFAIIFALLAPVGYAIGSNSVRMFKALDTFVVTAAALSGAAVAIVPLALIIDGMPVIHRADTWAALLFVGIVPTGIAFIGVFWLMSQIGATATSTVTFIAPVSAVVLGVLFLGEVFGSAQAAGMAFIFIGLALTDGRVLRALQRTSLGGSDQA